MKGSREKNLKSLLIGLSLTSVILPQSDIDRKPITALLRNVFSKKKKYEERKRFIERNNCTLRETGREKNHEKVRDREIERGRERERRKRKRDRKGLCL